MEAWNGGDRYDGPLAATVGGSPTRMIGVWQGSAAQAAAELLPAGISIAAAFQISARNCWPDMDRSIATCWCAAMTTTRKSCNGAGHKIPGVRAMNGGKLENARIVESITALLIGLNIRYKCQRGLRFQACQ